RSRLQAGFRCWRGAVVPLVLLLGWQYLSGLGPEYAYAFVPLPQLWHSAVELAGSGGVWRRLSASLGTARPSLVYGGLTGLLLALARAWGRRVDWLVSPVYHCLGEGATLGLIPLVGLRFGNAETAKLVVVSMATFEGMVLN